MPIVSMFDPQLNLDQAADLAAAGLSFVDVAISASAVIQWDEHTIHAQKAHEALNANGLNCGIVHSNIGIDDIDIIVKSIEVAHAMGSEFITIKAPSYDTNTDYRAALADLRGCFQDLNQLSAETGVDALLSIQDDSICPNADSIMRVLEGLDPSQVGVLFNPTACNNQEDCLRAIDVLGPFLRACSVSPADKELLAACLPALPQADNVLISVHTNNAKTALGVL